MLLVNSQSSNSICRLKTFSKDCDRLTSIVPDRSYRSILITKAPLRQPCPPLYQGTSLIVQPLPAATPAFTSLHAMLKTTSFVRVGYLVKTNFVDRLH